MTRWARCYVGAVLLSVLLGGACKGDGPTQPPSTSGSLPAGVVARVGDQEVAALTVARVASERKVTVAEASELAVEDALMAAGAGERLGARRVQHAERTVLGRALLRQLWLAERAKPITDEELAEVTDAFWTHYDRPEGYRVVHALAMVPPDASAADREAARQHAERMHEAVEAAAELARNTPLEPLEDIKLFGPPLPRGPASKRFMELAKGVKVGPNARFSVKAQELPVLTADGHAIKWGMNRRNPDLFDPKFVKAMMVLKERGDLTDVVETPFGYHVILLLEVTPAHRLSKAERLDKLRDETLRVRALRAERALLEKLRGAQGLDVVPNQDALLELLDASVANDLASEATDVEGDEG